MLESKYGSPKIVNDGVTVAKEVSGCCPSCSLSVKDLEEHIEANRIEALDVMRWHCEWESLIDVVCGYFLFTFRLSLRTQWRTLERSW